MKRRLQLKVTVQEPEVHEPDGQQFQEEDQVVVEEEAFASEPPQGEEVPPAGENDTGDVKRGKSQV
jgi:hypothetical protein